MDKFMFLFSEGIKNLWRHKLTAFSAIFSIFLTLIIAGSLIITSQNTNKVIEYLRGKYKIEVFFNDNISVQKVEDIVSSFNKIDGVRSTTIITKNDAENAVFIEAEYHCMNSQGVHEQNSVMVTSQFRGWFSNNSSLQDRLLALIKQ